MGRYIHGLLARGWFLMLPETEYKKVIPENIPPEMKSLNQWVCWKLEKAKGRNTKVPYQANGHKADSTDQETWSSFEDVCKVAGNFSGIGFVLSEDSGIMGLDFDHVRDPETGKWDAEALDEIKSIGSYAEISPSGTGAHVICIAKIPGNRRRAGSREMYETGRYFTVTGNKIEGTNPAITVAQKKVTNLYNKWFPPENKQAGSQKKSPKLSDEEVLTLCRSAKNADKFNSLYAGNTTGFSSQSEADLSLCSIMAFYTQDEKQLNKLLCGSGLYREKWNREDYGVATIRKAVSGLTDVYDTEKKGKKKSSEGKPKKIIVHFDEVAKWILSENNIFSMRDNGEIYLYNGGVYESKGTDVILGTEIRNQYISMFLEKWEEINSGIELPEHIPETTAKFVSEVLAYIRAYTHITRESIEHDQAKYINFKNCLFNLETWETEDHSPEIKTICQIPVYYNKDAICPKINDFLNSIVAEADINLLCEIAGYCLTTDCSFQKAFMLYGVGSNGKSVFLALLESLIGGENTSAESLQKLEFDKYRTAKLYGKRVNICGDIPDSKMHKSEVFKKLTSGLDLIDGENKYQNSFVFRNTAKLVFSANILPEGKKDKAYYRRWVLIKFPNNFEGGNEDRDLISKLREPEELSGFLNLALEGLKRLKDNGKFSHEKSIEDTQKEYEFNSNPVAAFMDECTKESQGDIDAIILYSTYTLWAEVSNKNATAYNQWGKELKKLGYENYRDNKPGTNCTKKVTYWCNIALIPEAQDRLSWNRDEEACPNYTVFTDDGKTNLGQAGQAYTLPQTCLQNKPYCHSCVFCDVEKEEKRQKR